MFLRHVLLSFINSILQTWQVEQTSEVTPKGRLLCAPVNAAAVQWLQSHSRQDRWHLTQRISKNIQMLCDLQCFVSFLSKIDNRETSRCFASTSSTCFDENTCPKVFHLFRWKHLSQGSRGPRVYVLVLSAVSCYRWETSIQQHEKMNVKGDDYRQQKKNDLITYKRKANTRKQFERQERSSVVFIRPQVEALQSWAAEESSTLTHLLGLEVSRALPPFEDKRRWFLGLLKRLWEPAMLRVTAFFELGATFRFQGWSGFERWSRVHMPQWPQAPAVISAHVLGLEATRTIMLIGIQWRLCFSQVLRVGQTDWMQAKLTNLNTSNS